MNQKSSRKAELHCAYEWTCDECGRNNFASAITVEMTPGVIAGMIGEHGGEEGNWHTGHWMTHPEEVTCQHCGATFETEDWEEPEKP